MSESRKKILVLGGTGAIGMELIELLGNNGFAVTVTSRQERENKGNINYLRGNARNDQFLDVLLVNHWDCIIDFMSYGTDEFRCRVDALLSATDQYIFISSARVYAPSECPLTERSPRLLDVCKDTKYLATDEYALAKARQEDLLRERGEHYTIVRPSLTYNRNRLQFAMSEKEEWLWRALRGQSIIFPIEMKEIRTTMTWGKDVAAAIAALVGNRKAVAETVHITGSSSNTWQEILEIYQETLEKRTGQRAKVFMATNSLKIASDLDRTYQIKYARQINRVFDNTMQERIIGRINFTRAEEGLRVCLEDFLASGQIFGKISARSQGYFDRLAGEYSDLSDFSSIKQKGIYILARHISHYKNI